MRLNPFKKNKVKNVSPIVKAASGNLNWLAGQLKGIVGRDFEISRTTHGAAQSYYIISYVEKCIELISTGMVSLPYVVKRFKMTGDEQSQDLWEGEVIAKYDDVKPRHPIFKMFNDYYRQHNVSLLLRIAIAMTLYDETYLELIRKNEDYPVGRNNPLIGLDWLNPLGMSFYDNNGEVSQYFYSPTTNAYPQNYWPFEVAYHHGFNPRDDLRGYPDVLSVLESLNIDQSIQRAVVNHFQNGIHTSAAVSQKDGYGSMAAVRDSLEGVQQRSSGVEQVGNWTLFPRNMEITPMAYPAYDQITAYSQATIDRILDTFGVPRALIGNSDIAGYKQGDEVTYRFYTSNIIPRASELVEYINRQIIPLLPEEFHLDRLVVDSSEFDRVTENDMKEAELADKNLKSGIITINQALKRQGIEELPDENGNLLMIAPGTILVAPTDLKSGYVVGTEEEQVQGDEGGDPALQGDVPPPADAREAAPDQIAKDYNDGFISLGQAMIARGQQLPPGQEAILNRLYKVDGTTMPIEQFAKIGQPEELPIDNEGNMLSPTKSVELSGGVDFANGNDRTALTVLDREVDNSKWTVEKAHKEIDSWYKFIVRKGSKGLARMDEFNPIHSRGTISDWLLKNLEGYDKLTAKNTVKWYFEEAKRMIAVKSIQATRIDFEDDFEDALTAYIDGNIDRSRWSRNSRAMIRLADNKAFRDGLADGGVEGEEPSNDEKAQINQFIAEQSKYVTLLGDKVKSGELTSAKGRGKVWFNKSVMPMYQSGLASSAGNKMAEWVLGKTEKHCKSCSAYNGQRHRYKVWMQKGAIPQSDELACHGDNCDCDLVFVRAKARGRLVIVKSFDDDLENIESDPAYVYAKFKDDSSLVSVQNQLKETLSSIDGVKWESPDTFHVTMVYAPHVTEGKLNSLAVDNLSEYDFESSPLEISTVGVFDTPDGQALHLVVNQNQTFKDVQSLVYNKFSGVEVSEYSVPDNYNPHITMAYVPSGIEIPEAEITPFELGVSKVVYGRNDYEEVLSVDINDTTES